MSASQTEVPGFGFCPRAITLRWGVSKARRMERAVGQVLTCMYMVLEWRASIDAELGRSSEERKDRLPPVVVDDDDE